MNRMWYGRIYVGCISMMKNEILLWTGLGWWLPFLQLQILVGMTLFYLWINFFFFWKRQVHYICGWRFIKRICKVDTYFDCIKKLKYDFLLAVASSSFYFAQIRLNMCLSINVGSLPLGSLSFVIPGSKHLDKDKCIIPK